MKPCRLLILSVIIVLATISPVSASPPAKHNEIVAIEAAWIESLQQFNGAIITYADNRYQVQPYFANLAATAMAQDPTKLDAVKKYITWYLNHLNLPDRYGMYGTVYDYDIAPDGREISRGDYDSADSYAATFISLLRAYYDAGGDIRFLSDHKNKIDAIGAIMVSLLDNDNLTRAKPDYHVKFLMDNSEVYKGFTDMALLSEKVLGDPQNAVLYQNHAANVKTAILTHFKNDREFYVYIDGTYKKPADWSVWYPDSTAQIFPIVFDVIPPADERAKNVYGKLNKAHPEWAALNTEDAFPWAVVGYTAVLMGDFKNADSYFHQVKSTYIDKGHPWPWYNNEAGWFLRMNQKLVDAHNLIWERIINFFKGKNSKKPGRLKGGP